MAKKKAVKKHRGSSRAKSRGLVLGHLERISSAVFDKYKQVITEMVGGRNGRELPEKYRFLLFGDRR